MPGSVLGLLLGKHKTKQILLYLSEPTDRADQFNHCYCRVDRFDFTVELSQVLESMYTDINDDIELNNVAPLT